MTLNDKCLLCGSADVNAVLSLPPTPPANALERPEDVQGITTEQFHKEMNMTGRIPSSLPNDTPTFPLDLLLCAECGHLQLGVTVDPEILFRDYTYVSPPGMLKHWENHCAQMIPRFGLKPNDLVVEIGSNNGDLLDEYQRSGMRVWGFEPATKIAEAANARGVATLTDFFTHQRATVWRSYQAYNGNPQYAKLVLANNVFAHVANLRDAVDGVKTILAPDGVFIFEVHWRGTLVEQDDWQSVYHEHLHYHAVRSLRDFLESCGMRLFDVQPIPTHNGSIRCFAKRRDVPGGPKVEFDNVESFINREMFHLGLFDPLAYTGMHVRIERAKTEYKKLFDALYWGTVNAGGTAPKIAVLGCPAKLTTLAYTLGLDHIEYVCDDAAEKQGKLTPGKRWPVVPFDRLGTDPVDIAIVGVSNYTDAVIAKAKAVCAAAGRVSPVFIALHPTVRICS